MALATLSLPTPAVALECVALVTRRSGSDWSGLLQRVTLGGATLDIDTDAEGASFATDGSRIAYVLVRNGKSEIVIANNDGSNKRVLASGLAARNSCRPVINWRLDDTITYIENRKPTVFALDVESGGRREFYDIESASYDVYGFSLSADGRHAALDSTPGVYVVDIPSSAERKLQGGCGISISPDGSKVSNNRPSHQDFWVWNFDGAVYKKFHIPNDDSWRDRYWNNHGFAANSNRHVIYQQHATNNSPKWSLIWVLDIETGKYTQVTPNKDYRYWARDFWLGQLPSGSATPAIALDKESLRFSAQVGAGDPPGPQEVRVTNAGSGSLGKVTVEEDATWLTVTRRDPRRIRRTRQPTRL